MAHKHKWQYAGLTRNRDGFPLGWTDSEMIFVCECGRRKFVRPIELKEAKNETNKV